MPCDTLEPSGEFDHARHDVGQELAAEYGALNAGDQMIARITPEHVVSENNITEIG
ncbi:MAG: hypothetical protein L0K86_00295 [Actinomycetia bacterium]|nr:hypothetical protein [Actinomycetes bacterium]